MERCRFPCPCVNQIKSNQIALLTSYQFDVSVFARKELMASCRLLQIAFAAQRTVIRKKGKKVPCSRMCFFSPAIVESIFSSGVRKIHHQINSSSIPNPASTGGIDRPSMPQHHQILVTLERTFFPFFLFCKIRAALPSTLNDVFPGYFSSSPKARLSKGFSTSRNLVSTPRPRSPPTSHPIESQISTMPDNSVGHM